MGWDLKQEGLNADGNSTAWEHDGGLCCVHILGDFGSGTAVLQSSPDDGTTYTAVIKNSGTDASWTSAGVVSVNLPRETMVRVNLSGSTSPDLDIYYQRHSVGDP